MFPLFCLKITAHLAFEEI